MAPRIVDDEPPSPAGLLAHYLDAVERLGGGEGIVTTDFGSSGDYAFGVVLDSQGRIVLAGHTNRESPVDFAVARYTEDGLLDTSFGGGDGVATSDFGAADDRGYAVAVDWDGRIVVAGHSDTGSDWDFAVVRSPCFLRKLSVRVHVW